MAQRGSVSAILVWKINKRSSFYPSVSLHLPFSGSFEKVPTGCMGVWKLHRLKTLKDDTGGERRGIAVGHSLGGWASVLISCKTKAAWAMESQWVDMLIEKERTGKQKGGGSTEKAGLEIQRVENQGWLGWKKQAFWTRDTWSTNLMGGMGVGIISDVSEFPQPPTSKWWCKWINNQYMVRIEKNG